MTLDLIFSIIFLIFSVIIHEVSHGYAASMLGDETARAAGRLTLNPLKHLDPVGSVIVPILTYFAGFVIGWAKPVPVNPYNLRGKYAEPIVAFAGPLSNIIVALFFGLLIRFGSNTLPESFIHMSALLVLINIVLALFNLVPIPPLDGSKILFGFLPYRFQYLRQNLERFGFFLVLIFVFFLWQYVAPIVNVIFGLITGFSLM
ncbi:site-2 protease family protein [Candidatus Parcubacteria bacterium]|nr:site-2 protease family protein [Candidatus Parcubacteria bacterium]